MSQEPTILRIMPREMRLMSERILSLTDLPKGFALAMGDVVMYSEAMKLGGFALLEKRIDDLKSADPSLIVLVSENGEELVLDAGGQHAWIVLPSALDLLDEVMARSDNAKLEIVNVIDPSELGIAAGLGRRTKLDLAVKGNFLWACATEETEDLVLSHVLEDGCQIAADLWWRIFALAQTALVPDSVVSRRHAGNFYVTEDGQIVGRTDNDDHTDLVFVATPETEALRS